VVAFRLHSRDAQLETIETASLDGVTGGCGAGGQNCAAGPVSQAGASPLEQLRAFARR
jgi:hypothetical protein